MTEILVILACVPLYVANSFCDKIVSSKNVNNYLYNVIKFFICSLLVFPMLFFDESSKLGMGCLLCGVACGFMYAISKTVILKGYEKTSVAFMTLCHASGMILPCIIGHFCWNETLGILSIIGIVLAVFSIVLLKDKKSEKKDFDFWGIVIGIIVFMTSGGVMIAQKLMGRCFEEQSVGAFNLYSFVVAFLILLCFIRPKYVHKTTLKPVILCASISAASLSVISLVMTYLASKVPSVVLFPLFNGVGIIAVCIGSAFAFKEKLNVKKIIGLIVGIVGLCLVNF